MTNEEFYRFCAMNEDLRIEQDADKRIHVMPPTNSDTGNKNARLLVHIGIWNEQHQGGELFDSSTGFQLPNGAFRSPDLSWIQSGKWAAIPQSQRRQFAPIAPDFVVELRSPEQSFPDLRAKMEEYRNAGCRLGWLIDPQQRQTFVYDLDGNVTVVPFDQTLDGGDVLPGLTLRLADLF